MFLLFDSQCISVNVTRRYPNIYEQMRDQLRAAHENFVLLPTLPEADLAFAR